MLNLHRGRNQLVRAGEKNILVGKQNDIVNVAAGMIGNLTRRSLVVDVNENSNNHNIRAPWRPPQSLYGSSRQFRRGLHGSLTGASKDGRGDLHGASMETSNGDP